MKLGKLPNGVSVRLENSLSVEIVEIASSEAFKTSMGKAIANIQ